MTEDTTVEVDVSTLRLAIAALSFDAERGYRSKSTSYADLRHAAGRQLAEPLDEGFTDIEGAVTIPEHEELNGQ